ncbi:hypothetical protein CDL12_27388 [Handroanthus impetiginosus]|uniref:Transcription factor, Myb superfamily n=1 Tax=Handroanthus impetiginosus TaxID=429701 RepID=A0A2G9G5B8_9LAMI|nr:hypothetical protein CDL12_27388 [Handroanthus impetiginosus]
MKKMGCSITNESEDGVLSADSPLSNDGDNSGGSSDGGIVLKKGPWTSAEDAILIDYVKKHGEGNWNAVQKHSGLARCGKSCRLRWANHLRPNLKKGAFTLEEEQLIIELHAKMGNKWARMAAHLPGRTDNEIKNYWNTRIKRRQRAGLPLYPPELCLPAVPENQQSLNSHGLYGGDKGHNDILQTDNYKTPDFIFDSANIFPYTADFPDISASGSLITGFGCPQFYNFAPQTLGLQKSTQDPDELMSDYGRGAADEAPSSDGAHSDNCENKISQSFGFCFSYEPNTKKLLPFGVHQDSHFMSNGFLSASKPFAGAEKLELPSLQYQETGLGVWDPAPESIDSFVQSSTGGQLPSDCPSPRSSGLLEALLYEAKFLSKSENQLSDKATSSTISAGDVTDSSALKTCSADFKGYLDPTSPSANSMGSIFNECTPTHTVGSSLEEKLPAGLVKSEAFDQNWNQLHCYRPEAMLGSSWLQQGASFSKQQGFEHDSIAAFLNDDLGSELNMSAGTCACSWGLSSCTWNNMPAVCQMSDHR